MLLHIIETHNTLEDKKFSLLSIGLLTMTFIIFSYDHSLLWSIERHSFTILSINLISLIFQVPTFILKKCVDCIITNLHIFFILIVIHNLTWGLPKRNNIHPIQLSDTFFIYV
jgi:hypothetical protein